MAASEKRNCRVICSAFFPPDAWSAAFGADAVSLGRVPALSSHKPLGKDGAPQGTGGVRVLRKDGPPAYPG